jgi:phage shock protein E
MQTRSRPYKRLLNDMYIITDLGIMTQPGRRKSSLRTTLFCRIFSAGIKHTPKILYIFFFIIFISSGTPADEQPVWWKQLADEAKKDGYGLVTMDDLKRLYDSKEHLLILDTRTDYEFKDGHLPDAVNLPFDLGDKLQLRPEKKKAFLKLLGPDKERKIIIYCRGFR